MFMCGRIRRKTCLSTWDMNIRTFFKIKKSWGFVAGNIQRAKPNIQNKNYKHTSFEYIQLKKKKWKEIIDVGTGTERKDFRLKEEFDLVFGTKPSANPVLTLDSTANITSDNPSPPRSPHSTSPSSSPPKSQPNKGKQHPKKRKLPSSKSLLDELTIREKEFNSKIEKFHQEKMQRMDRFLDLFEKSLEKK